jgi:hypothetical protein
MTVVVPDLAELFEEAYERAGLIMRSGYDLKTARRSLNILTLEWQNRGLNLFTIEAGTIALTQGTATFTMPANTIDLIEHQLRTGTGTSQQDTAMERISVSTYAAADQQEHNGSSYSGIRSEAPYVHYSDRVARSRHKHLYALLLSPKGH